MAIRKKKQDDSAVDTSSPVEANAPHPSEPVPQSGDYPKFEGDAKQNLQSEAE
jgi:hypothetical protein